MIWIRLVRALIGASSIVVAVAVAAIAQQMIATFKASFFINHDKEQADKLKLVPAFYD